jgi:hypothetical protein
VTSGFVQAAGTGSLSPYFNLNGTTDPTGTVTGTAGQLYVNTVTSTVWVCSRAGTTHWRRVDGLTGLGLQTTDYFYIPHGTVSTYGPPADGGVVYVPAYFDQPCTLGSAAVECTTAGSAGSVTRLGIFAQSTTTGGPGTLILDAGQQASTTSAANVTWSALAAALDGGWYFFAICTQGGAATPPIFRTVNAGVIGPPVNSQSTTPNVNTVSEGTYIGTGLTGSTGFASNPTVTIPGIPSVTPPRIQYLLASVP